jgi:hypothetical protein
MTESITPYPPHALVRNRGEILGFWEVEAGDEAPHDPSSQLEAWTELIQISATELVRREEEILWGVAGATGFSMREARRAVRGGLGELTRQTLMAIWEEEGLGLIERAGARDGSHRLWPRRTAIFTGGPIPQPGIQALVGALMVSGKVLYRPSRQEGPLARMLVATMAQVQEAAGGRSAAVLGRIRNRVMCASWPHEDVELTGRIAGGADALIVFGGEAAVDTLVRERRPEAELFVYGPRMSFAVLDLTRGGEAGQIERAMQDFAEDVVAFDQRGCLSPAALFVLGGEAGVEMRVAEALAGALDHRASEGGFAPTLPPALAAEIQSQRAVYAMDPSGSRSLRATPALPGWTILVETEARALRPTPGYQTIRVERVADGWEGLAGLLTPWAGKLQAMGLGPDTALLPESFGARLDELGLSRVCPLGRMQSPPLAWTHDGNPFFPVRISIE